MRKIAILGVILCVGTAVFAQNRIFTIGNYSIEMVPVQGGEFYMGAQNSDPNGRNYDPDASVIEGPVHKVRVSDFWISKYPISQNFWWAVTKKTPHGDNCGGIANPNCNLWYSPFVGTNYPAYYVSYNDLRQFLNLLNNNEEIKTQISFGYKQGFYAPTEAQWEFAARGGNLSKGYRFAGSNDYREVAWTSENAMSDIREFGKKLPNELGLYDMCGNVAEWCSDAYNSFDNYPMYKHPDSVMVDPTNSVGNSMVQRGGRFARPAVHNRITTRYDSESDVRMDAFGARLVLRYPIPTETTKINEKSVEKIQIFQDKNSEIIRLNGGKIGSKVAIFSIDGRCVFSKTIKNESEEIQISAFSSGIYILKAGSQQLKFVKK